MALRYLLVAVVAAAIAIFALQNSAPTSVRFLIWTLEAVPLAAIILVSAAAALVAVGLPLSLERWRLRRRVRALEARLTALEDRPPESLSSSESG